LVTWGVDVGLGLSLAILVALVGRHGRNLLASLARSLGTGTHLLPALDNVLYCLPNTNGRRLRCLIKIMQRNITIVTVLIVRLSTSTA
jgi:hypothetical protein